MLALRLLKQFAVALFVLVSALQVANAQATRTWVSGVGDDANPCSRTAPCKTFAGAISKTAPAGEINVLDPGGFGAVTITKAITIDGSLGSIAGVLVSGTNGIIIAAGANDVVTLRNLDINGLGSTGLDGIKYLSGLSLHVENCRIYGFAQQGIEFVPSTGTANALFVSNTKLLSNAGGGIWLDPGASAAAQATLTGVIPQANLRGLRVDGGASAVVRDSVATGNSSNGFIAAPTDARVAKLTIDQSTASSNGAYGVYAGSPSTIYLSNMQVTGNSQGLAAGGGSIVSFGNNHVAGNATDGAPTQTISNL